MLDLACFLTNRARCPPSSHQRLDLDKAPGIWQDGAASVFPLSRSQVLQHVAIPAHNMSENQALLHFEGPLEGGSWYWSLRAGQARYEPHGRDGFQTGDAQEPQLRLQAEVETMQEHLLDQLAPFRDTGASLNLKGLIRLRQVGSTPEGAQEYRGFWGFLHVENQQSTVFGADPDGKLRFRRGPWEPWPQDLPRFSSKEKRGTPLIMSPFCGTLLHEAVGHGMEAEFLAGSLLKFRFGDKISPANLTVMDRPDHPGYPGSMALDDTGMPASQTTLVHRGVLVGDLGTEKGVWRRASFADQPLIRASNFLIAPGKEDPRDWLKTLPKALYVTEIQSGNWLPGSQKLKVLTGPIYLLENGDPVARRPWAVFEFSIMQLLQRIEAVGGDFRMDPLVHWCMKKHQAVPMGMGSPSLLIGGASS